MTRSVFSDPIEIIDGDDILFKGVGWRPEGGSNPYASSLLAKLYNFSVKLEFEEK